MSVMLYRLEAKNQQIDLHLFGRWTLSNLSEIEARLSREFKTKLPKNGKAVKYTIFGEELDVVDTSAILIFEKLESLAEATHVDCEINYVDMPVEFESLKSKLANYDLRKHHVVNSAVSGPLDMVENLGKATVDLFKSFAEIPQLFGLFLFGLWEIIRHPLDFKLTSMIYHVQQMTLPAVAIVASVSFMVGAVLTEQAAVRLPGFGTETLVVGLIGMVTARETSILLTGMLVAGRSSSSITAEIGSMQMNEEIDAMKVIGLDVMRFLVMPRAMAMLIALPILTFISIVSGISGSAVLMNVRYGMSFSAFIELIYEGVTVFDIGTAMVKTPFIAISMVLVACSEGLKVRSNAASLGHHTTISVVKSLFLVIIIDSIIAIYFTQLGSLGG